LPFREIVDNQNKVVVMIAVENFDINPCLGHSASDLPELTRLSLVQPLDQHLPFINDMYAGSF
jgi:hypothetical protein